MKKVVDDVRLMIKVCDMYYNHGLSQQEIATELSISRPTLSRLLNGAKEKKLIRIQVENVDFVKYWELGEGLKKMYRLHDVIIADCGNTESETKENIGKITADYLEYLIEDQNVVGISMGSTLAQVVNHMKECDDKNVTVIPLVGGVGQASLDLHSNVIAEKLASCYHSDYQPIFVPARVYSQVVRNELMKDPAVAKVMQLASKLDIAVLGIGYPNEQSSIKATGYFAENEMEMLIEKGVAGEINMQFYDIDGNTTPFKDNNYVVGVEVQKLKKIPITIGVAGGPDKEVAIKGAIRGGYINTLVTDVECARALLKI